MRLTKSSNKRIILATIFMAILIFILGLFLNSKSPALAWEPPGAYGNPAYSGTQSSMSTYSSLTKYTASDWSFGATDTTELTYDTWRTKYKSPTLKTGSATFVKTAKLADNLYHAMLAGKLKLTVSASAVASASGAGLVLANARVTHKIKSFICIGNISGTGLARDNFITTALAKGGEDTVTHTAIASQTLSSSASYSGAPSSGQYVRYGISVEQSGVGSALGILVGYVYAFMDTITFSLTLANNGDTTAPTISGTNNAFTASSAVTISDTGSNLWKYTLNGTTKTYGAKVSSATITLAQGSNSITAYDNLGNSARKTIKYYKPTIKVTSSLSSSGTVTLNGSSTLSQSGKTVGESHVMQGEVVAGYYLRYWQKESGVSQGSYYGKSYTYKIPENEAYTATINFKAYFEEIAVSNKTVTYNGKSQGISFSPASGFTMSYNYKNQSGTPSYDSSTAPTNAGKYNVTVKVLYSGSEVGSKSVVLTIEKRSITISADNKTKTYGDGDPSLTCSVTSGELGSGDTLTGSLTRDAGETVGSYTIKQNTQSVTNAANYTVKFNQGALTITERSITITANNKSKTYGDSDPSLDYTLTGTMAFSDEFAGSLSRSGGNDVGTYTINQGGVTIKTNAFCYNLTYNAGTFTINKRSIAVSAIAASKIYGENDPNLLDYKITSGSLAYSDGFSGSLSRQSGENVGTYNITQGSFSINENNYSFSFTGATFTINKKLILVRADDKSITYGDAVPTLSVDYGDLVGSDTLSVDVGVAYNRYDNAGRYDIVITEKSFDNYDATFRNAVLTVSKREITVNVDDITISYGDSLPPFNITFSNLVNSDTLTANARALNYNNDAGQYTIEIEAQTYTNYEPSYQHGVLTVHKADASITGEDIQTHTYDGTIKNIIAYHPSGEELTYSPQQGYKDYGEYNIQISMGATQNYNAAVTVEFVLIINKKQVTVTVDNKSKEYGDNDPELTYQHTGIASVDSFSGRVSRTSGDLPGDYEISQGNLSLSNNYIMTFEPGVFTIVRRNITITADNKSKTYGEIDPSLTYAVTSGNLLHGEVLIGELSRVSGEDVGTYAINQGDVNNANNSNYNIAYESGNLNINRRAITISAIGITKTYGEADPALTYNITSGSLVGDDELAGELGRESGQDAGIYDIIQNSITNETNPNYDISYIGNTFSINKKQITVIADDKEIAYGDDIPIFTVQHIGLEYDDSFTESVSTDYKRYEDVGLYYITIAERSYDNYTATYERGELIVTKKSIIIRADDVVIDYGDYVPTYTATYVGLVNNDELYDYILCEYRQFDNAGEYAITVDPTSYTNYSAIYESGTLTVEKIQVIITPHDESIVYGEQVPEFSISYSGLINNDTLVDSATTAYQRYGDTGKYDITIVPQTYTNYYPDYQVGTLTVTKAPVVITAEDYTVIYGEELDYPISYEGLLNNDVLIDTVACIYNRFDDIGTYALSIVPKEHTNYEVTSYIDGTLTVVKRELTIKADSKQVIYGDTPPAYTISYENLANNDELGDSLSCGYQQFDGVGEYAIVVNENTYTNYIPTYVDSVLTVIKKEVTVTADNKNIVYGESIPTFTFNYDGLVSDDTMVASASTVYERYNDVGSFAIEILREEYDNYLPVYIDGTLTVSKAPLIVRAEDKYIKYGQEAPEFTFVYEGIINNDILITQAETAYKVNDDIGEYDIIIITESYTNYIPDFYHAVLYVNKAQAIITADIEQVYYYDTQSKYVVAQLNHQETPLEYNPTNEFIEIGEYNITISSEETLNYLSTSLDIILRIEKPRVTIDVHWQTKVYGEEDPELTFDYAFIDYVYETEDVNGSLERAVGEDADTYDIYLGTVTAGEKYQIVYSGNDLVITPRPLTLTAYAVTKVYGDDDPYFAYEITEGNLVGDDILPGELSRDMGRDIGSYRLTLGSVINANYDLTLNEEYLVITRRPITISADDMEKRYGDVDPELTYTITSGSLAYDDTIGDTVSRQSGEDVGQYDITIIQSDNNNYEVTYEGNIFTIFPRAITITADDKVKYYGDEDEELTYYVSVDELAFDDELAGTLIRAEGRNVGEYEIYQGSVTSGNNTNYVISYVSAIYTIERRPITLTADSKEKIYGDSDPSLTFTVTVGNIVFDDVILGNMNRDNGENVGQYVIRIGSISNNLNTNYDITFIENYLSILRRPITIKASSTEKTYGYNDPPFGMNIIEGELVGNDTLKGSFAREDGEDVGEYAITQGTLNNERNSNYDITFVSNSFMIKPRSITITANYTEKEYGDTDPIIGYKVTTGSLVGNDELLGRLSRDSGEERGEYNIYQGSIDTEHNANYDISFIGNIFTIVKRKITVQPVELFKIYGDEDPALVYEFIDSQVAFDEELVGELVRQIGETVGSYIISAGSLTNENNLDYEITFIERDFEIIRRPLTLTPAEVEKTYGYPDFVFEYEITQGNLVFDDELVGELSREEGENVGSYRILHGSLSNENNPNYDIELAEEYLIINRRAIEIVAATIAKIYGQEDPIFTYDIMAGSLVGDDELSGSLSREVGEDVGVYKVTIGTLNNPNYEIEINSGSLIINPRPLTLVAENISFLHGSAESFELKYTIEGNPLAEDEELIAEAVRVSTSARPDSRVAEYPIILTQIKPLKNYVLTLENGTLTIQPGQITGVYFEDRSVLYDGDEHYIYATGNVGDYDVEYTTNGGSEVGIYYSKATFTKENYEDLELEARLIIMTNEITTSEMIPEGIVTVEEGIFPYIYPVIMPINDEDTVELVESVLTDSHYEREVINKVFEISLYENGSAAHLDGSAYIKLLIPSNVKNLEALRLVRIEGDSVIDIDFAIEKGYVLFEAEELGSYAFIMATEEVLWGNRVAEIIYYSALGILLLVGMSIIIGAFKQKKKKKFKY